MSMILSLSLRHLQVNKQQLGWDNSSCYKPTFTNFLDMIGISLVVHLVFEKDTLRKSLNFLKTLLQFIISTCRVKFYLFQKNLILRISWLLRWVLLAVFLLCVYLYTIWVCVYVCVFVNLCFSIFKHQFTNSKEKKRCLRTVYSSERVKQCNPLHYLLEASWGLLERVSTQRKCDWYRGELEVSFTEVWIMLPAFKPRGWKAIGPES